MARVDGYSKRVTGSRGAADRLWYSLAALWALTAGVLLLVPASGLPAWPRFDGFGAIGHPDWLGHAVLFALGALFLHRAFLAARWRHPLFGAVTAAVLYSLALEGAQRFVPGRLPELADGLANATGVCGYAGLRSWLG